MKYCCPTGKNIFLRVRNIFCVQLEIWLPTHVVQLVPVLLRRLVLSVPLYFLNLAICLQPLKKFNWTQTWTCYGADNRETQGQPEKKTSYKIQWIDESDKIEDGK